MKKLISVFTVLVLLGILGLAGCSGSGGGPLRVAMALGGSDADAQAAAGLQAVAAELEIETTLAENVDAAGAEEVLRGFAKDGYSLIIAQGAAFEQAAATVAGEYPKLWFVVLGSSVTGDNLVGVRPRTEDAAYLFGMLSTAFADAGMVGLLGAYEQPGITKDLEAFKVGAKRVSPDLVTVERYIGSDTDTELARAATVSMVEEGATCFFHSAGAAAAGMLGPVERYGMHTFGWTEYAPDSAAVISSIVCDYGALVESVVRAVHEGKLEGGQSYAIGMEDGVVDITSFDDWRGVLPEELANKVDQSHASLKSGELQAPYLPTPTV